MVLGGIFEGEKYKADATFIMSDDDFIGIINGDEDPQQLFMEVYYTINIYRFFREE